MNNSIVLSQSREILRRERKSRTPSVPEPLNVSRWIAMSAMQKGIRRADEPLALHAAATLFRDDPVGLWRRLGCIAAEDVGIGGLDALGAAVAALAGKRARADLGGEWAVASTVVQVLCESRKCRSADDLLMVAALHPALQPARNDLGQLPTRDLARVITDHHPLAERAIALWYWLGTQRGYYRTLQARRGDPSGAFDFLCETGFPHTVVELAREGFRRTGDPLLGMVALLSRETGRDIGSVADDAMPDEITVGSSPGWAFDLYSREGRSSLQAFLEGDSASARWIVEHVPKSRRVAVLGHAVFRVEGGCTRNRIRWPVAQSLRSTVDVACAGVPCLNARELLGLVREDIPGLNRVRSQLFGGAAHDQ